MTYRQRIKAAVFRVLWEGDPWMTEARFRQLAYELAEPVGREKPGAIPRTRVDLFWQQEKTRETEWFSKEWHDFRQASDQLETYTRAFAAYIGPGTCLDVEEKRQADRDCDLYEKHLGF